MSGERLQDGVEVLALFWVSIRRRVRRVGRDAAEAAPGIRRRDRNRSGSSLVLNALDWRRSGRTSLTREREFAEPARTRRKAAGARPDPPRSSRINGVQLLARAPATASPPARTASCFALVSSLLGSTIETCRCRLDDDRLAKAGASGNSKSWRLLSCIAWAWANVIAGSCSRRSRSRSAPAAWRAPARKADRRRSRRWRAAAAANTRGAHFAPSTNGRTRCVPNDIAAPEPLFRQTSYASGVFLPRRCIAGVGEFPLRRLDAPLGPTAQRLPPEKITSSTIRSSAASASFNSPSSPSTASTIDDTRLRSSGCARNVVISASSLNSPTAIPSPPAESIKSNLPGSV